jgi:hypothetical protein
MTAITPKSKSKLCYDRRSVGQSVLVSTTHQRPKTRFFFIVRQLRVCWHGAPSLTKGRVCRLQLLLALASAVILGTKSHGTHYHILLTQILDSPNLEGHVPVLISPRNRVAVIPPGTRLPFRRLLRGTRTGLHAGKSHQLSCDEKILWHVDPLLGNDCQVSDYTTTVAK